MAIRIVPIDEYEPALLKPLIEVDTDAFGFQGLTSITLESYMRFGKVFVGYDTEEIVAVAEFIRDWNDPQNAYLVGLGVKKDKQNQGLGTLLMKDALERLQQDGFRRAMLHVPVSNVRALHVYEKLGFVRVGIRQDEYSDGEDRILMHIDIPD